MNTRTLCKHICNPAHPLIGGIVVLTIAIILALTACEEKSSKEAEVAIAQAREAKGVSMPSQSYVGMWENDNWDELIILEIGNTIKFELNLYRLLHDEGNASIENNRIIFSTVREGVGLEGTLKFNENSISLTVDKAHSISIEAGTTYNFTNKKRETK